VERSGQDSLPITVMDGQVVLAVRYAVLALQAEEPVEIARLAALIKSMD
jgi:hypothetical protein